MPTILHMQPVALSWGERVRRHHSVGCLLCCGLPCPLRSSKQCWTPMAEKGLPWSRWTKDRGPAGPHFKFSNGSGPPEDIWPNKPREEFRGQLGIGGSPFTLWKRSQLSWQPRKTEPSSMIRSWVTARGGMLWLPGIGKNGGSVTAKAQSALSPEGGGRRSGQKTQPASRSYSFPTGFSDD